MLRDWSKVLFKPGKITQSDQLNWNSIQTVRTALIPLITISPSCCGEICTLELLEADGALSKRHRRQGPVQPPQLEQYPLILGLSFSTPTPQLTPNHMTAEFGLSLYLHDE